MAKVNGVQAPQRVQIQIVKAMKDLDISRAILADDRRDGITWQEAFDLCRAVKNNPGEPLSLRGGPLSEFPGVRVAGVTAAKAKDDGSAIYRSARNRMLLMEEVDRIPYEGTVAVAFDGRTVFGRYMSKTFDKGPFVITSGHFAERLEQAQRFAAYLRAVGFVAEVQATNIVAAPIPVPVEADTDETEAEV